jgi:hypothetical protein
MENKTDKPVFALDVGSSRSGWAILEGIGKLHRVKGVETFGKTENLEVLRIVQEWAGKCHFAIEYPKYQLGQPFQDTHITMATWVGRIMQRLDDLGASYSRIYRYREGMVMLNSSITSDAKIRAAVIAVYGPPGTKKNPGPTYGVTNDAWQAIAVGTTYLKEGDSSVVEATRDAAKALKKVIPKPKIKI